MRLGLSAIGAAVAQIGNNWLPMLVANLVAVLLSLPLLLVTAVVAVATNSVAFPTLGLVLVAGILPNPMAAGVQYLAFELAHREGIFLREQWEGLRRYAGLAFRAWVVALVGTAIIVGNLVFYGRLNIAIALPLRIIWLYLLFMWICLHLYVYPLIMEQKVKRLRLIYRNAFVMATSRPGLTTVVVIVWLIVLLLTAATGLAALLGLSLAACIQQNATAVSLPTFDEGERVG